MSFPPPLPNNPMFQAAFAQAGGIPPMPRFQLTIGGLPFVQPGSLPMGVTVPAGVGTVTAPPVRNQNAGVIAAPPMMSVGNPLLFQQQPPPVAQKPPPAADPNKKVSMTTVFVGNITDRASDMLIRQLLTKCGSVHNWKRIQGPDGKLQAFGFCDYTDQESAMRAIRLLHNYEIADKKLIVRVDAKTQEKLDEYRKNEQRSQSEEDEKEEDRIIRGHLYTILKEHEIELSRDPDPSKVTKRYNVQKDSSKPENLSELDMEDEKRLLIHREIDKFRDTYKKYDEEKEEEKRKKDDRTTKSDRNRDSRRSGQSRRSRDKDKRSRNRRTPSTDDELDSRRQSQSPLDEEELILRRRQEKQIREKEHSYQRRLKDWEAREARKVKDYERQLDKENRRKEEEEIEKQKLKQFLQDYDDDKHDPKYYKGRIFQRRQMERHKEIEQDNLEREQERKELDELRQRLADEGHPDPESEVRKRLHTETNSDFDDRIKMLMSEARNNSTLFNDEDSRDSGSAGGVKTFGFAGMKISSGAVANLDTAHISNGSAPAPSNAADVSNEHSNSSLPLSNNNTGSESRPKRLKVSEVFNSNEDEELAQNGKKRRPPPNALLEDSNTDSNLSAGGEAGTSQLSQEEKRRQIKNLIDKIPTSKNELFNYTFDWDLLDSNLMERRIRPWINKKISDYIGEEEQTLLDFICKKLLAKSSAQSLLDDVAMVLDDEAQIFVVKLWRLLIYEIEAKKLGINKN